MIGTHASPTTVATNTSQTGTLDLTGATQSVTGVYDAFVSAALNFGSLIPTSNPTVQWFYSVDGTNYDQDGGTQTVTPVASQTVSVGWYPPMPCQGAKVTVTNNDSTRTFTVWAKGSLLSDSNL